VKWHQMRAKYLRLAYSTTGPQKGEVYDIEYKLTGGTSVAVRVPEFGDTETQYANLQQLAGTWKQERER
jgi:hypothetical protein